MAAMQGLRVQRLDLGQTLNQLIFVCGKNSAKRAPLIRGYPGGLRQSLELVSIAS